jgi:putative redox protein
VTKRAHLVFHGGLRFETVTGSGNRISQDSGGTEHGASPREVVLAALGACGGMDVAAILVKKRQRVTRHEIDVVGDDRAEHPQMFTTITVTHEVEGPELDPEAVRRAIELSATRYCPVNAMLAWGKVQIVHRYVARSDAGETRADVVVTGPDGAGLADPLAMVAGASAAAADTPKGLGEG